MKGNNELRLNEATIIDAVQEYLDKRMNPSPKVDSVKMDASSYQSNMFLVNVSEKTP